MNRIKEAIGLYNQTKSKDEPRMTQKRLSKLVMHDYPVSDETKEQLMVWWIQEERKVDMDIIRRLCKTLKMTADFIVGL